MSLRDKLLETVPNEENHELRLMKSLNVDRNTFNSLTDKTALNLIGQQHDKADEVETVCFGLETDDGEIVKVYVNAEEGEAFEKALGDMLGDIDDVEEAIDKLSDEYDIVSVEWPEDRVPDGQQQTQGEQPDGELDNPGVNAEEEPDAEGKEYALDFDLSSKGKPAEDEDKSKEKGKEDEEGEEEKPEGEKEPEEEEKPEEEEGGEDEFDFGDLGGLEGEEEEEEEPEEKGKKGKKKSKKKPAKEKEEVKESFLYSSFLNKPSLLEKEEVLSKKELKLEDIFKTAFQQKIVKLLCLMDFPVDRLLSRKSAVRKGIRAAALDLQGNAKAKSLVNRLIKDLSALITHDEAYEKQRKLVSHYKEEDLKEAKDLEEQLTGKMQKILIQIFKELGVPSVLLNSKTAQLKQDIRKTAKIFATHAKIKGNLIKLAHALNVDHGGDEELKEALMEADAEPAKTTADFASEFSPDKFSNLIIALALELGIPQENLDYKQAGILTSIRAKKAKLNSGLIRGRILGLYKALQGGEITNEELTFEEANAATMHRAADLGDWTIGKLGSNGIILEIEDVSIKIQDKNLSLFRSSFENGLSTFIKDGNDEWEFRAINHGKEYVAINEDSDNYLNGIIIHEKDVDKIIDVLDDL